MTVGVYITHAAQLVDLAHKVPHEGADPASQDINNGLFDPVCLNILHTRTQCGHIVPDGLGCTDIGHLDVETPGIMINFFLIFRILAGYMVAQLRMILMIFRQLVHKGFIAAVGARDSLGADNKDMLHGHISFIRC